MDLLDNSNTKEGTCNHRAITNALLQRSGPDHNIKTGGLPGDDGTGDALVSSTNGGDARPDGKNDKTG
eukprot:11595286-Karenia_brevis.AAC.1